MESRKRIDLSPLVAECRRRIKRVGISSKELKENVRETVTGAQTLGRDKLLMRRRLIDIAEESDYEVFRQLKEDLARGSTEIDVEEYLRIAQEILSEVKAEEVDAHCEEDCGNQLEFLQSHVICPLCLRSPAYIDGHSNLVCRCGLNFPLPFQMTLEDVEGFLNSHSAQHSSSCSSVPGFFVVNQHQRPKLVLACSSCSSSSVIFTSRDGSTDMEMDLL